MRWRGGSALVLACSCAACQLLLDVRADRPDSAPDGIGVTTLDGGRGPGDGDASGCARDECGRVLASGLASPIELVVERGRAFWINSRDFPVERVAWCELPDCADRRYIDAPSAYTLKAFGDGVAWATTTGDYVYGASDGGAKVLGANYAGSIATSGRWLYATTATTMVYCAENGCGAALWAVEPGAPAELSSGAGWLAWTLTPSGSTTPLRWIRASTTAGLSDPGGPHTLVEEPDGVAALAVDGASVYWAKKSASGGLFAASLESAGPRVPITLVSGERINSVAVGVREVFYTNAEAGSVSRVRIEGGASPVVVSRRAGGRPSSVRIREPFVYWIEKTDGSLRSARIE